MKTPTHPNPRASTPRKGRARTPAPTADFNARPTAPDALRGPVRHDVEVDEARERAETGDEDFALATPAPTDGLAEELGEDFVRNVTGANDAASELRGPPTADETGGPFVETTGETEYGFDDESAPPPPPDVKKQKTRS